MNNFAAHTQNDKALNKKKNIVLLGASLESDNRGVNALGLGAISLLADNYDFDKIKICHIWGEKKKVVYKILAKNKEIEVEIDYLLPRDYRRAWRQILSKRLGIRRKPINNDFIEFINQADIVFDINEGDSFSDIYGKDRILRHSWDSIVPILLGKPLIFLPQTIGPFNTLLGKFLSFIILKNCQKIFVRDSRANKYLNSIGVKFTETKDMSIYMEPKKVDLNMPQNAIGFNVNGVMYFQNYESLRGQFDEYKSLVKQLIQKLLDNGEKVVLIPHTYNVDKPCEEDDLLAIKEIYKEIKHENLYMIGDNYDAQELKYIISQMKFFIGSRMHSNLAALTTSVPTVGIAYSYKFIGTFSMFEVPECTMPVNNITVEKISGVIAQIMDLIENKDAIKQKLITVNANHEGLKFE